MSPRHLVLAISLAAVPVLASAPSRADLIRMNVDPAGTTSNQTLFGTVLASGSAIWPASRSQFRDYQFELQTATGTTSFDQFAVQLSGQLRQSTPGDNLLRATLWAGPIVANPLLSNSLVTVSTPNSSMTSSGYSSVVLSGSSFASQLISTSASTFFFRVWAGGASQNNGYQTKMAATLGEYQNVTMDPAPVIDRFLEYDTNGDGVIDSGEESSTRDIISEVPEPASIMLSTIGLAAAASFATRRLGVTAAGSA